MIGGSNPIPDLIGGGMSLVERVYWAMRSSVGSFNASLEEVPGTTVEGAWRWCRALAIAAMQSDERATTDTFLARCTDTIPVFEAVLHITAPAAMSEEERRQTIIDQLVHGATGIHETLEADLQAIDPLFTVVYATHAAADTTEHGRGFEDYVPADPDHCGPAFGGGRSSTGWPNYSSDFVCIVQYGITPGAISAEQRVRIIAAEALLNRALPAWVDYAIVVDPTGGFLLDISLLDLGAFGS